MTSRYVLQGRRRYVDPAALASALLPDGTKHTKSAVRLSDLARLLVEAYRMGREDGRLGLRMRHR